MANRTIGQWALLCGMGSILATGLVPFDALASAKSPEGVYFTSFSKRSIKINNPGFAQITRMSSGFVSGGVSSPEDDAKLTSKSAPTEEAWGKAEEAIKLARWQQEESASKGRGPEEKSLYEILQANKARKQEEFEEKLKFKHQFKQLDEDDVEFLDSIMSEQARTELLRKQELASQLSQFRKAQYEAESAGNSEALENIPKVEDVVVGGWAVSGKKRKKTVVNETAENGARSKIRKMSGIIGAKTKKPTPPKPAPTAEKTKEAEHTETKKSPTTGDATSSPKQQAASKPQAASNPLKPTGGGLMGLVTYSSDDDD
ncbi:N-terminal domain of NEFA-interacting nuclear protein NIP30-domain-containing protein [Kalaharituber pfeilii]|nr:N-terminal domain of NEFA-interacting nuclear protein NIP30-domain-containing protein [Kalaharituber pfeilii]